MPVLRCGRPTGDRSGLAYPAPAWRNLFLPEAGAPSRTLREEVLDELIEALALGIKDYYRKTGAFRLLGIALSGGRDSMLTLLIAWRAAQLLREEGDPGTIHAFYMPTRYSGEGTRDAASTLCEELGVPLLVVPIEEAFDREVEATRRMLARRGADAGHPAERPGAPAGRPHVELGQQLRRRCSSRPAT